MHAIRPNNHQRSVESHIFRFSKGKWSKKNLKGRKLKNVLSFKGKFYFKIETEANLKSKIPGMKTSLKLLKKNISYETFHTNTKAIL